MLFNWAFIRAFHGLMQSGNGGGGPQVQVNPQAAPPPAARTTFSHEVGDPSLKIEDRWVLPGDSPVVTAFPFLRWALSGQATRPRCLPHT